MQTDLRHQFEVFRQDLRFGLRVARRSWPHSLAILLTLVIGIGLNAIVLSLFNGLLFRAHVSRDPASFVQIYLKLSGEWQREIHGTPYMATMEDFETVRAQARTLTAVTVSAWVTFTVGGPQPAHLRGKFISCNYQAVHMRPVLIGRSLADADCRSPGGEPVVVLSERGWRLWFGGDPAIVGRTVVLNNFPVTVIGVTPDDMVGDPVAALVYAPYTMQPVLRGPDDYFRAPADRHAWLTLSGRLRPGTSLPEAQAELKVIARSLDRLHPGRVTEILATNGALIREPGSTGSLRLLLGLGLGCASLILVLVCANVTTLMLARAVARREEMALRLCLGASRSRLIRQLLTETLALALGAAAVSCVLASVLPGRITQWMTDFPLATSLEPDWRVFGVTFGLALLAGCAAGVSPALESMRIDLSQGLRSVRNGDAGRMLDLRGLLLGSQLAISLALLVCMGLIVRAQHRLIDGGLDYNPERVLVTSIDLARYGYSGRAAGAFYDRLLPRLQSLPGVRAVALTSPPPFRGRSQVAVRFEGHIGSTSMVAARAVSPEYFPIAGVRLVRGRVFTELETRQPSQLMPVIVSEALVRTFLLGTPGLGQRLRFGNDTPAQIVGVVSGTSSVQLGETDGPILYRPMYTANVTGTSALILFEGDTRPLTEAIRSEVQSVDGKLSVTPETVASTVAKEAGRYTAVVAMTAVPSGLALFLALAGIYGVTAFAATERTREIGVRTALGARPHEIVWLFLGSLRRPLLIGATNGFVLAWLGAHLLERANLLVSVPAGDPLAYGGAMLLLSAAAVAATVIPALRVARRDPWCALRGE